MVGYGFIDGVSAKLWSVSVSTKTVRFGLGAEAGGLKDKRR
jgi:hypothetical protein